MKECPYCEKSVSHIDAEAIDIKVVAGVVYHGLVLVCPHCRKILTATVDPVFLANQILQAIKGNT